MRLSLLCIAVALFAGLGDAKRRGGDDVRNEMLANNRPSKTSAQDRKDKLLGDTCDDCKLVVGKIRFIADNPIALEEAKVAIEGICHYTLSGDELTECLHFADNLKQVIERFKPLLDNPELLCQQIYLCGSMEDRSRLAQVVFMAVKRQVFKMPLETRERNALCDECKFVISEAKTIWDQKTIQRDVEESLESLCSSLGQYQATCKDLVDQYWPTIVQFIDEELADSNAACSSIGLCATRVASVRAARLFPANTASAHHHHAPAHSPILRLIRRFPRVQTREGNAAGCAVCVYSFTAVVDSLKDDPKILGSLAQKIEAAVLDAFPAAWGPNAADFLNTYLEPVLLMAVEQVTPKELCTAIQACSANAFVPSLREVERLTLEGDSALVCESCRVLAEALKVELEQESVRQEIKAELEAVCDFVPGKYAQECDNLVSQNIPEIMRLIANYVNPDNFCPELGLCPLPVRRSRLVPA